MLSVSRPVSDARTPALIQKLKKTIKQVSSRPSPEQVHQLRTTVRRLETLLAATGKKRSSSKLLKQLARLRRPAGKVRDIDVQMAALREIRLETAGADKARVMRRLQKLHKKREKRLIATTEAELADGLSRRLKDLLRDVQTPADLTPRKDHTAAALEKFAKLVSSYPQLNEETLHDFRMACKRVRYLAEISGETPRSEQVVSQLKRIQDGVGEWHDWVTLIETAEDVISVPHSPLLTAVRTRARSKFIQALRVTAEAKTALLQMHADAAVAERRKPAGVVEMKRGAFAAAS